MVGLIPGSSSWETNFDVNTYAQQGTQNQIYKGRIRYKKKLLWYGPTISHNITNQSHNAPAQALPFDTYSGGLIGFTSTVNQIPIINDLINVENEAYGFIPVVSALDIKKTNGNLPVPDDYLKTYSGGIPQDPDLISGFDSFVVDDKPSNSINYRHLSFQTRNGNWLADELQAQTPADYPVVDDCSHVCDIVNGNGNISGASSFCSTADFTITNFDPTMWTNVSWQITPSTAGSISPVDSHTMSLTKSGGFNGPATITLNLDTENCGEISITRNIYMGRPVPQNGVSVTGPNNLNPGQTGVFNVNTSNFLSASSFDWTLFSNSIPNAGQYFELNKVNNGTYTVKPDFDVPGGNYTVQARATNFCGFHPVQRTIYVEEGDGVPIMYRNTNHYKVYPNPATSFFNIDLVDQYNFPVETKQISGQLLDINGVMVRKINMVEHKANVDTFGLRKGVYILRITYNNETESHQVIVE